MLRHSLMNESARALPVGALATYALKILNSTALTRSTVSCRCPSAAYRAADLDLRLAHAEGVLYGMELGSVTLKINNQQRESSASRKSRPARQKDNGRKRYFSLVPLS